MYGLQSHGGPPRLGPCLLRDLGNSFHLPEHASSSLKWGDYEEEVNNIHLMGSRHLMI